MKECDTRATTIDFQGEETISSGEEFEFVNVEDESEKANSEKSNAGSLVHSNRTSLATV